MLLPPDLPLRRPAAAEPLRTPPCIAFACPRVLGVTRIDRHLAALSSARGLHASKPAHRLHCILDSLLAAVFCTLSALRCAVDATCVGMSRAVEHLLPWLELLITFVGSVVLCCFMQPAGHRTRHPVPFQPLADASARCTTHAPCNAVEWFDVIYALAFFLSLAFRARAPLKSAWADGRFRWPPTSPLWCIDFTVAISSVVAVFAVPELRAILTLRLWQLIGRVRGLRTIVHAVYRTGAISKIVLTVACFMVIFAQSGVALFAGGMRHACHVYDAVSDEWNDTGDACDPGCTWSALGELQGCAFLGGANHDTSHAAAWWKQTYTCEQGMQCRCSTSSEADAACTFLDNPNYGMSSFDAAPWALITM